MIKKEKSIVEYSNFITEEYLKMLALEKRYDKETKIKCNYHDSPQCDKSKLFVLELKQKREYIKKFFFDNYERFTRNGCLNTLNELSMS